jgi:GDP-4-dehydro-6-deoxy-D-mannose reductase
MISQSIARVEDQKVFITGITGGIGRYLAKYLLSEGVMVYGFQRKLRDIGSFSIIDRQHIYVGDLLDSNSIEEALDKVRPSHIYHLAGAIDRDVTEGNLNYELNVKGTIKLLNSVGTIGITPKILIASSSAVYGEPVSIPIKEEADLRPWTHYAVSKVTQEMIAVKYGLAHRLPIIRARTFNVIGPDLSPSLLCSDLARQIAYSEKIGGGPIRVGNIQPHRDFTDVRDVVRAYELLLQSGSPGEVYNVCSMASHSVKECLDVLLSKSSTHLTVDIDQSRYRTDEIKIQVGDSGKINKSVGWSPRISFEQSLEDSLNGWRAALEGACQ